MVSFSENIADRGRTLHQYESDVAGTEEDFRKGTVPKICISCRYESGHDINSVMTVIRGWSAIDFD